MKFFKRIFEKVATVFYGVLLLVAILLPESKKKHHQEMYADLQERPKQDFSGDEQIQYEMYNNFAKSTGMSKIAQPDDDIESEFIIIMVRVILLTITIGIIFSIYHFREIIFVPENIKTIKAFGLFLLYLVGTAIVVFLISWLAFGKSSPDTFKYFEEDQKGEKMSTTK